MSPSTKPHVVMDNGSDDEPEVPPAPSPAPTPALDNDGLPALFWDELPDNTEDNPDFAALQALRDECTPEERAETYKANGNGKLTVGLKARNKLLLREAVEQYSLGLAENCSNQKLNAVLLSNRSHVQSLLGNWRKALEDARDALKLDPSNIKAYFRAARAALKLGQHQVCLDLCSQGRAQDSTAKEFDALEKEAQQAVDKAAAAEVARQAAEEEKLKPARELAAAIMSRGYKVTLPQLRAQNSWHPTLNAASGHMTWPVVVLYPEGGTQDEIQAWDEHDTVTDQLDQMFGPDAPDMEWDGLKQYRRDTVELYYLSYVGKPLSQRQLVVVLSTGHWPESVEPDAGQPHKCGGQASRWVRVQESWSLQQLLSQPDFIIPGVPLLACVAKGTEYRKRFLQKNKE